MTVAKEILLKGSLPEAVVDVPGVGEVRVRGLSRAQVHERMAESERLAKEGPGAFERWLLSRTMVEPVLTEAEVGEWQKVAASGQIDAVVTRVNELSAIDAEAAKRAYKEFEAGSADEFRILPGPGAGDDGGSTP